jgi:Fe-S cluster assembly iron-binding protein IscA
VPIEVTTRAVEVLRRALEAGRMDPGRVAIRISIDRGGELRTGFAEEVEPGEESIVVGGVRLLVPAALGERGAIIDVADEHDRIVLR